MLSDRFIIISSYFSTIISYELIEFTFTDIDLVYLFSFDEIKDHFLRHNLQT